MGLLLFIYKSTAQGLARSRCSVNISQKATLHPPLQWSCPVRLDERHPYLRVTGGLAEPAADISQMTETFLTLCLFSSAEEHWAETPPGGEREQLEVPWAPCIQGLGAKRGGYCLEKSN